MEQELLRILEKFYKKLQDNVIRSEKSLLHDSVLLTLINAKSNTTSKLLNDSSIKTSLFLREELRELEKNRLVRVSDDKNKLDEYILTSLGLYKVEKINVGLDEEKLLEFFQNKFFSFKEANKPLNITEKIIILSMIGARTFSKDSTMNLKNEIAQDNWLKIFKESYEFLLKNSLIKQTDLTFEKQGNEHPVSYVMRRLDKLPKKTQHIYVPLRHKMYYLDLSEDGELSQSKLKRLFELIFRKIDDNKFMYEILKFCNYIAYKRSKFVKDDFSFIEPKFDEVIKAVLREFYLD